MFLVTHGGNVKGARSGMAREAVGIVGFRGEKEGGRLRACLRRGDWSSREEQEPVPPLRQQRQRLTNCERFGRIGSVCSSCARRTRRPPAQRRRSSAVFGKHGRIRTSVVIVRYAQLHPQLRRRHQNPEIRLLCASRAKGSECCIVSGNAFRTATDVRKWGSYNECLFCVVEAYMATARASYRRRWPW